MALSAKYFGASIERDSWIISGTIVTILVQLLFGPLNEILRARFVHLREEYGKDFAISTVVSIVSYAIGLSIIFIILCYYFTDQIAKIFAPGFSESDKNILIIILRFLLPTLLLSEITVIWTSVLNAYGSYYVPDTFSLISVVINVVSIFILAPFIGIYSLIVSGYLNLFFLLLALGISLFKMNRRMISIGFPKWTELRLFIIFSLPFYLSYSLGQLHSATERIFCTLIGVGSVSVLDYARKFTDIPFGILQGVTLTLLTPLLASLFINNKMEEFKFESRRYIRFLILGLMPITVLLTICSHELVLIVLLRGAFPVEQIDSTAKAMFWFGIACVGLPFYIVSGQALVAREKVRAYTIIGSIILGLSILSNYLFYNSFGVISLAASWSICHLIGGIILYFVGIANQKQDILFVLKTFLFLLVVLVSCFYFHQFIFENSGSIVTTNMASNLLIVGSTFMMSIIASIISVWLFNLEEKKIIIKYVSSFRTVLKKGYFK